MSNHTNYLVVVLICLAGAIATERIQRSIIETNKPYGPLAVEISGVDVVTVGIPYGFQCIAQCVPECNYTWTHNGQKSYGSELDFLLKSRVSSEFLVCVATNPVSGMASSNSKNLSVTEGPWDINIDGPAMLLSEITSTFTCSSDCYPSCTFSWIIDDFRLDNRSSQVNVTPADYISSETITCEAQNTLSGLFAATTIVVWVALGPSNVEITGPTSVTVGQSYEFLCLAECTPSCNFTWSFLGKTLYGDQVYVPILQHGKEFLGNKLVIDVEHFQSTVLLTCVAVNSLSGKTETSTEILHLTDPVSVRPVSQAQPIAGRDYALQCVGAQNPSYIQWTLNGEPLTASSTIHFANDNGTVEFTPLLASEAGVYECIVSEGGTVIPGMGYQVDVVYGPSNIVIIQSGKGPVGQDTLLLPGARDTFVCSADCYPGCNYVWTLNGNIVGTNSTLSVSPVTVADNGTLACSAYNTVSQEDSSADTQIEVVVGPVDVTILGPSSVEVGVKATFVCSAECTPPCSYTWNVYGRTVHATTVQVTVNRYVATESVSCTARNTVTGQSASVNETINVSDPDWCGC